MMSYNLSAECLVVKHRQLQLVFLFARLIMFALFEIFPRGVYIIRNVVHLGLIVVCGSITLLRIDFLLVVYSNYCRITHRFFLEI